MKLALAWIAALALTIVVSCSVNHRSGDYACTLQSDCTGGRTCQDGFCAFPPGTVPDGPVAGDGSVVHDGKPNPNPDGNPTTCPTQCTSCDLGAHTCKIECNNSGNCTNVVVCPPGFDCTINCGTSNSCRNGVTCPTDGSACNVVCSGVSTCRDVQCGPGKCDVQCTGSNSCRAIACDSSCACDVMCAPGALCDAVSCAGLQCSNPTGGCSSALAGCNTCP